MAHSSTFKLIRVNFFLEGPRCCSNSSLYEKSLYIMLKLIKFGAVFLLLLSSCSFASCQDEDEDEAEVEDEDFEESVEESAPAVSCTQSS